MKLDVESNISPRFIDPIAMSSAWNYNAIAPVRAGLPL
jgi:hypothetical protein